MPPLEAKENRIEDALATELAKIGVAGGAGAWLTVPTLAIGVPLDGLSPDQVAPSMFLQYVSTEARPEDNAAGSTHWSRATWHLWLCSSATPLGTALRTIKNLNADVLRALYPAEGTITAAGASGGVWSGVFTIHPELAQGGGMVGILEIVADFDTTHTTDP